MNFRNKFWKKKSRIPAAPVTVLGRVLEVARQVILLFCADSGRRVSCRQNHKIRKENTQQPSCTHKKKTQTEVIFRTASLLFLAAAISRRVSWPAGTTTAWSSSDSAEKLQRKTHRLPPQHLLVGAYTRVCVSVCVRPWNRHILSPSLLHIHTGLGCLCCTR